MPIAGTLMRSPMDVKAASDSEAKVSRAEVKYHRMDCDIRNLSTRFKLANKDFHRQYFHLYNRRMEALRPRVEASAKASLPSNLTITPLCRLDTVPKDEDVLVVGTVFKQQELKPSILKALAEENGLAALPEANKSYITDKDELILEDDLQRIKLRGDIDLNQLVTGVVCGVFGREVESGKFSVKKIFFPTLPAVDRPITENECFIVLMSGLELGDSSSSTMSSLQLAIDFISGEAGEMDDQERNSRISRVIIAGNSLNESTRDKSELAKAKYLTKDSQAGSIEAVKALDDVLVQLAASVDVDLMPGEFDPSSHILPQQPLHPCLFPQSSAYPTLKTTSNPYHIEWSGLHIMGTSGQNTDDIARNSTIVEPMAILESVVRWAHIAPTCPDTLGCFPFRDSDPFILDSLPHVLFTANQDAFGHKMLETTDGTVSLISIPSFSHTQSVVYLNLRTLVAEEVKFASF